MPHLSALHRVANRENLSSAQAEEAMQFILNGQASTAWIAAFAVALKMKGETADEITGFARAMRKACIPVTPGIGDEPLLDTCGTGGGGPCTFNVSTIAAFVVAGAGVKVAKHGNRSNSTQCGSADLMEALGVKIAIEPELMGRCIREAGIGFLFAPAIHPAMKHARPAREELRMRTAFNFLGPLTNPAGATAQLVGAPSEAAAELIAQALASLGLQRGYVVYGLDGLDEITTTHETLALEIRRGAIAHHTWTPADFNVPVAKLEELAGAGPEENSRIAREVLNGKKGARRNIVLVNAAAALVLAGKAENFTAGMSLGATSIDSGAALNVLQALVTMSNETVQTKTLGCHR